MRIDADDLQPACATVTASAKECCALCTSNPACTCFSWLGQDGPPYTNKCCLKTSTQGRTSNPNHTSGVVAGRALQLTYGIAEYVTALPRGFTVSFVLQATASAGLDAAMDGWGAFLMRKYNTSRLQDDPILTGLGYWTDNGGYYYGGKPLKAADAVPLFARLRQQEIPIRYLQLDPFWCASPTCLSTHPPFFASPRNLFRGQG